MKDITERIDAWLYSQGVVGAMPIHLLVVDARKEVLALREEVTRLAAEKAELVKALQASWIIVEHEYYTRNAAYGHNFNEHRVKIARDAYSLCRAALAKVKEGK